MAAYGNLEVDELALEFGDALAVVPGLASAGLITEDAESMLQTLDGRLRSISGGRERLDLWTPEGLETAPEWAEIRLLAAATLDMLGGRDARSE